MLSKALPLGRPTLVVEGGLAALGGRRWLPERLRRALLRGEEEEEAAASVAGVHS
jgi:hypothetical protein